jgi:hypothetical protein
MGIQNTKLLPPQNDKGDSYILIVRRKYKVINGRRTEIVIYNDGSEEIMWN